MVIKDSPTRIYIKPPKGFQEKELLGARGIGKIYRGKTASGVEIAVENLPQFKTRNERVCS